MRWRPMAEMPDELRDGRQVLFWCKSYGYMVSLQYERDRQVPSRSKWRLPWDCECSYFNESDLTSFAEITPPGDTQ